MKTILCPLPGTDESRHVLEAAFAVGREVGAHVEVLHIRPDAKETIPLLGEGMSVSMVEEMISMAEKEAIERAKRARAIFDELVARDAVEVVDQPGQAAGASVSWHEETGREEEGVARRGRLNDMVVVGRPDEEADVSAVLTLNAALFETGRPVLVVPPEGATKFGGKVAISWNGSAQAAQAVSAAVPILEGADEVLVLTADSPQTSAARAGELVTYLQWHGISPQTKTFEAGMRAVGEQLLEETMAFGADLLVMGAYTHNRFRQLILGGVTKHVLGNARIPVLMAH